MARFVPDRITGRSSFLLGGRLGDLLGHRNLFLAGAALFTAASTVCGFAESQGTLIGARAVQGVGGPVVSAAAFSLMMALFINPAERAKAMGFFGFIASGGGSIGALLGGSLPTTYPGPMKSKPEDADDGSSRVPPADLGDPRVARGRSCLGV
jgi:MFS family permease